MNISQEELFIFLCILFVDDVDHAAGVQDIEDGVVENEGALILGIGVVTLCVGKGLDLHRESLTTSRIKQFMITTSKDIMIPFITIQNWPVFSPYILKLSE
jgi:hypothetical protein